MVRGFKSHPLRAEPAGSDLEDTPPDALATVGLVAVVGLDVADQPDAVLGERAANRLDDAHGVRHVVQAVEAGHEAEAPVLGEGLLADIVEMDVLEACRACVGAGAIERVLGGLVTVVLAGGKGLRDCHQRDPAPAAHVRYANAPAEGFHHPFDPRQGHRNQQRAKPGPEAALDAARALGADVLLDASMTSPSDRLGAVLDATDGYGADASSAIDLFNEIYPADRLSDPTTTARSSARRATRREKVEGMAGISGGRPGWGPEGALRAR